MHISDITIIDLLKENNLADNSQIEGLRDKASHSRRQLQDIVIQEGITDETTLVKAFADQARIPFIVLDPKTISQECLKALSERIARQYNAIVFKIENHEKYLAMEDPDDVQAVDFLQKELGLGTRIYIATRSNILDSLEAYRSNVAKELNQAIEIESRDTTKPDQQTISESEIAEDSPIAKTVNLLLEYAIRSNASDIHIEPREDYVQIRYRIDGVLREVNRLPKTVVNALVSRIKILSNLKIDERRVPQDGRFKITVGGKKYALRVSTLPISDGEKVVMRILDESDQSVSLDKLGFWGKALEGIHNSMAQSYGIVLVTGPTGSGKSTTLFSVLSALNTPKVNISTIEDPIEYKIPGVNQTQTNNKAGMTFAGGLRALLRQDPNIIMVGEIRDNETADLAIQAALTGHLVFSTLHTNNAATALPRLLDMGIEPFLIASTARAIIGQRLVRRLSKNHRESYIPDKNQIEAIKNLFHISENDFSRIHELEKTAAAAGIGGDTVLSTTENSIKMLWRALPGNEDDGSQDGYKGRLGIYEVLSNTPDVQALIVANGTSEQIQDKAISNGMVTMQIDGLIKALRGETTIEEVMRVTRES